MGLLVIALDHDNHAIAVCIICCLDPITLENFIIRAKSAFDNVASIIIGDAFPWKGFPMLE